jgi:RNA polymerase sigma-70 factor (ECF subfamily)
MSDKRLSIQKRIATCCSEAPFTPAPRRFGSPIRVQALRSSCEDDTALVAAVVARAEGAAERLIARHDAFVRAVIRSSSQAAGPLLDDLTHEVYVHLWRDEFRVLRQWQQHRPLRAYLRCVIKRLVWERLSRLVPVREQPGNDVGFLAAVLEEKAEERPATPEEEIVAGEALSSLRRALDGINADYRRIIELRYYQDLSYREIAGVLGITPTNAGIRLSRALAQLKRALWQPIEDMDHLVSHKLSCARWRSASCNKLSGSSLI